MVHIINGEIVADDDPRVKARQQGSAGVGAADASRRRPMGGFGSGSAAPTGAAPPPGPAQASTLSSLGLDGTVLIPGFLGFPAKPVAKTHLLISAVVVLVFGWTALVFIGFMYFLSLQQPPTAQGAAPPPPANQGARRL